MSTVPPANNPVDKQATQPVPKTNIKENFKNEMKSAIVDSAKSTTPGEKAKPLTLKDVTVNKFLGRIAATISTDDDEMLKNGKAFINELERFEQWLRGRGKQNEYVITDKDIDDYLKYKNPSVVLQKLNDESLKLVEGLFPERVDYFREWESIPEDDKAKVDNALKGVKDHIKEAQYKERDYKLIASNYLELMNMLPDEASRKEAKRYLNTLLATKEVPLKFDGGFKGGANVHLIPTIDKLIGRYNTAPQVNGIASLPPITDQKYLGTIIQSVLIALLQGTVPGKDILNSKDEPMKMLIDSVKTGVLAHIGRLNDQKMQNAVAETAVLSSIASLSNDLVGKVMTPDTSYQDAIAKAAVLSLISSLAKSEKQDEAANAYQQAAKDIEARVKQQEELSIETAKMMLLVAQSALFKEAASADSDAALDNKISDKIAEFKAEIDATKETIIQEATDAAKNAAPTAVTTNIQQIAEEILREGSAGKSHLITELATNNKLANLIANAAIQSEREGGGDPPGTTFKQVFNTMLKTELDGINRRLDGLDASVKEVKEIVDRLEDGYPKNLSQTFTDIFNLLDQRLPQGGGMAGGNAQEQTKVDPVAQAKEFRKDLDEVKKTIRGITDAFGGLEGRFAKFINTLPSESEWSEIRPDAGTTTTSSGGKEKAVEEEDAAEKGQTEEKAAADRKKREEEEKADEQKKKADANKDHEKLDKKILGYFSYINEDGRKFVEEVKEVVSEKKKKVLKIQESLQKIFDADPTNPMFVRFAQQSKILIEGDYDKQTSGILSIMDKVYGNIRAIYDEYYSVLKSAAEGIKQNKEYAIREKVNQNVNFQRTQLLPWKGGARPESKIVTDEFQDLKKKADDLMKDVVQKVDQIYARKLNPAMSAAVVGEPTMFMNLYNNYLEKKLTSGPVAAARQLTEEMAANHLIPADVMKISNTDKAIFVFVTIVLRMISLAITKYLIERGNIKTLPWALGAFLFIYAIIFIAFVMFVNLDMYRLRILFNYINLHGNTPGVFLHIGLMWMFSFVIFLVMWNINFPLRGIKITAITDQEKADLSYRLEVLTMIVWIFLVLMIAISQ